MGRYNAVCYVQLYITRKDVNLTHMIYVTTVHVEQQPCLLDKQTFHGVLETRTVSQHKRLRILEESTQFVERYVIWIAGDLTSHLKNKNHYKVTLCYRLKWIKSATLQ